MSSSLPQEGQRWQLGFDWYNPPLHPEAAFAA